MTASGNLGDKIIEERRKNLKEIVIDLGIAVGIFSVTVGGVIIYNKIDGYIREKEEQRQEQELEKKKQAREKFVHSKLVKKVVGEKEFIVKREGIGYLDLIAEDLHNYPGLREFKNENGFHRGNDLVPFYAHFNMDYKKDERFNDYMGLKYKQKAIRPNWDPKLRKRQQR